MNILETVIGDISWQGLIGTSVHILLILVIAWIAVNAAKLALKKLEGRLLRKAGQEGEPPSETAKRVDTLIRLLRQGIIILVWIIASLVILAEFGVNVGPVLAGAGVAGLAIGFGAQNLVRDVISGFFLILENQVRVGDVAVVNGKGGLVESINFRTIVLRDLSGVVHVYPNGTIETLSNLTKEWSAYVFEIGVAYKEDVDRVMEIMRAVGEKLRKDPKYGALMVEDVEVFGVDNFGDSAVIIKGRLKTKPIQQWAVGREYLRRIKKTFDKEGIEIPFPHRSLYFGEASKPFAAQILNGQDKQ